MEAGAGCEGLLNWGLRVQLGEGNGLRFFGDPKGPKGAGVMPGRVVKRT